MGKKLCVLVVALIVNVAMVVYAGVRVKTVSVSTTSRLSETVSCRDVVSSVSKRRLFAGIPAPVS